MLVTWIITVLIVSILLIGIFWMAKTPPDPDAPPPRPGLVADLAEHRRKKREKRKRGLY